MKMRKSFFSHENLKTFGPPTMLVKRRPPPPLYIPPPPPPPPLLRPLTCPQLRPLFPPPYKNPPEYRHSVQNIDSSKFLQSDSSSSSNWTQWEQNEESSSASGNDSIQRGFNDEGDDLSQKMSLLPTEEEEESVV